MLYWNHRPLASVSECLKRAIKNTAGEVTQVPFISYPLPVIENLCLKKNYLKGPDRGRAQQVEALATQA